MPATRYKIWSWGNPVARGGATKSVHVGGAGVAKCANTNHPFVVSNELICSGLARAILLPVPPGFLIEDGNKGVYYVSMDFNLAGQDLPPIDPTTVVSKQAFYSCGAIMFDIWVVNEDRHVGNLAYDKPSDKVQFFDHSHALGTKSNPRGAAQQRLGTWVDKLGIPGHCLAAAITNIKDVCEWAKRIQSVPEFYLREIVMSSSEIDLSDGEAKYTCDFLLERRSKLVQLILNNKAAFPKVDQGAWKNLEQ